MDKCPVCGHWVLTYEPHREEWVCFCQYTIYNNTNNEGCHCTHTISEPYENYLKRLGKENQRGRYSVGPP
jgi:hypothetical protein